jgi:hypothetical protein
VLKRAQEFHELLSIKYSDSSAYANRPDVKVLLTFISRHESALAQSLRDYERGASKAVLESYFEATPDFRNLMVTDTTHIAPDARFEDVVELALRYDEALMTIYRECEREAASEDLRDAIHNLLEMEQREEVRVMRATLMD